MTPADAVRDALAPLALAGYDATPSGLVQALGDLGEARSLLAQWQADGETVAVMQGARAHLDAARAHRTANAIRPRVLVVDAQRGLHSAQPCPACENTGWRWVYYRPTPADLLTDPRVRALVEAARGAVHTDEDCLRRALAPFGEEPAPPVLASDGFHRQTASKARCPWCGAGVKWWCGGSPRGRGMADCQDGRKVSCRLPGVGEPCDWPGARVVRRGDDVVPDETDLRWRALRQPPGGQPTDPPPSADYVGPGWADGVPRGA